MSPGMRWDPFYQKGAFPPGCQLTCTLRRSGHHEDEIILVIWIDGHRSWRWGHLLVGEARRCLTISTYETGSSREGEAQASPSRSGGRAGSLPVAIIDAEKPWDSCTMAFSASMMPGISTTHFREGKSLNKRARSMLFTVLWLRSLMELPPG